ncbi:hypothetical protein NPIL_494171 [Nephila pilipes]|uniref:Uncharacterized protein n=1 Tax=Nephila pilipes TaxID=299642 RepID=A0A8X6NU33_NEPPI|nr:hypothetical protein NPIL_494171 [Nephila pilipes]
MTTKIKRKMIRGCSNSSSRRRNILEEEVTWGRKIFTAMISSSDLGNVLISVEHTLFDLLTVLRARVFTLTEGYHLRDCVCVSISIGRAKETFQRAFFIS